METENLCLENKLRTDLQKLIHPVFEQSSKHKEQFVTHIHTLNEYEDRLRLIEYALFKSEKGADRFDDLYNKVAECEQRRGEMGQDLRNMMNLHKKNMDKTVVNQENKLEKVLAMEVMVESLKNRCTTIE